MPTPPRSRRSGGAASGTGSTPAPHAPTRSPVELHAVVGLDRIAVAELPGEPVLRQVDLVGWRLGHIGGRPWHGAEQAVPQSGDGAVGGAVRLQLSLQDAFDGQPAHATLDLM